MAGFDTALNILNDAAVELGLYSTDLADPFASTDANVVLLRRLLKGLGQDLLRDHPWTHLQAEAAINTVIATASYALPADFNRDIDQTHWNDTTDLPLAGPASPQEWQFLKAVAAAGVLYKIFRTKGDLVFIHPTPTAVESLKYEYISRYWVRPTGQAAPTSETTTASTDTLHFDRRLLVAGLKLAFRSARGFDPAAEQNAYNMALARAKGGDGAAPVLRLSRHTLRSLNFSTPIGGAAGGTVGATNDAC